MWRRVAICLYAFMLALFTACSEEAASPIRPGGVAPALFGAIAAADYMAVGYLDLAALRESTIGTALVEKLAAAGPAAQRFDLSTIRRAAFAVRFVPRAWPNAWRAFRLIAALESDISVDQFEAMLDMESVERGKLSSATAFRFPGAGAMFGSPDDHFTVAFPGSGVVLLGNDEDLIMLGMEAMNGRAKRLVDDEGITVGLLGKADMTAPGWFVVRMGPAARNLLQMLPPFESCIGRLTTTETLEGLAVFSFANAEDARRMVASHELNLKSMEKFSSLLEESNGGKAWLEFLKRMKVSRAGKMVTFEIMLEGAGLDELLAVPRGTLATDEKERQ